MGNSENNLNDIDINDWVILNSPGGRYLGRVAGDANKSNLGDLAADLKVEKFTADGIKAMKEKVIEAVNNGDIVELCPALDFLAPLRPVPQPNGQLAMARDPIVVPVDFTVMDLPVFVKASSVYFLADLKGTDRNTYKDLVQGGLRSALHARAQASGLELAGGPLPGNGKVTPLRG